MGKQSTTKEFIIKAKEKHGDRYDYSLTQYNKSRNKIEIICSVHGSFWQTPSDHLLTGGCEKCGVAVRANKRKLNLETFIHKSNTKHSFKYDYSLTSYQGVDTKIDIICPSHGVFTQIANDHLRGSGCPTCGFEISASKSSLTLENFIENSKLKHGNRYNYSKSEYTGGKNLITIICPTHGDFKQAAGSHMQGIGCAKCAFEINAKSNSLTTEEFIEKAIVKNGHLYDYSLVDYQSGVKVEIICNKHGVFKQRASRHLSGDGCPTCGFERTANNSKNNPVGWTYTNWGVAGLKSKNFDSFKVYIIRCFNETESFYKIGKTFCTLKRRFKSTLMPYQYEVVKIFEDIVDFKRISDLEKTVQKQNNHFKYIPKIKFEGMYECFSELSPSHA